MAYALIAWQPAPGVSADQIAQDIEAALPGVGVPERFLDHVLLYPSPEGGIGYSTVRQRMKTVVDNHPGLHLMIIMPSKGETVAGWFDPASGTFDKARPIMNQGDLRTFPVLL